MQNKSYWFAVIGSYITMAIAGIGLSIAAAEQMSSLMAISRGEESMLMEWQLGGYLLITIIFTYIYVKGRESGGWQEGARFGALFGLMMCGVSMINYSLLPIEMAAMIADIVLNIIIYAIGGITVAVIYKPE